ncbi:hypothetical protein [Prochlorothrix hollandica]|nr:hypothetical protein [Prochlorothrix hollandica]
MLNHSMISPASALSHVRQALGRWAALGTLLGLGTGAALVQAGICPSVAQAYESQMTVTLEAGQDETYETFITRAETVGRAAAQRQFDNDILVTEVLVFVNGQKGGMEAPLLSIEASRLQWNNLPDPRRWASYYNSTRRLLQLDTARSLDDGTLP